MSGDVWIVDDSPLALEATRVMLASRYSVVTFENGEEVLERIAAGERPDLLVLDWTMPGVSGIEVCRFLRERHDALELPILLLSQRDTDADIEECFAAGANDHVAKPATRAELLARAGTLVRLREQARTIRASEDELSIVLASIPLLVSFVDADARYGLVNQAYEGWFGVRCDDLRGQKVRDVIGEAAWEKLGPNVARALAGESFELEEHDVPYRLGGTRDVKVSFVPHRTGERIEGYVAVLEDITARRRLERERETARAQVAELLAFEQRLIGIVSHDLRNPLDVISLSAALLEKKFGLGEDALRTVGRIQNAATRSTRLVADLLDFTRERFAGGIRIELRPVELHAIVRAVVEDIADLFPSRAFAVAEDVALRGDWDEARLVQVVQNLVTNAVKYSPASSVVHLDTFRAGDTAILRVHNEGAPIPAHKLPVLFEPFVRARNTDRLSGSVGLGLYIARQIVDAHHGSIDVTSTGTDGTTFTVRLPAS